MTRNRRSWIFGILFWFLFLLSIGLSGRYPWLDATWFIGIVLFVAVTSVLMVVEVFRNRDGSGEYLNYKGVPPFMRSFFMDDEDLEKRKLWDAKRERQAHPLGGTGDPTRSKPHCL
jgi:hypothetical protein